MFLFFFFFNDTATTEIYTLSLHDALPIYHRQRRGRGRQGGPGAPDPGAGPAAHWQLGGLWPARADTDRKSTRLNSSHGYISYAVFCLKKKNTNRSHAPQVALSAPIVAQAD